jgi:hypothetical protein
MYTVPVSIALLRLALGDGYSTSAHATQAKAGCTGRRFTGREVCTGHAKRVRYPSASAICGVIAGMRYPALGPTGERRQREGGGERGQREGGAPPPPPPEPRAGAAASGCCERERCGGGEDVGAAAGCVLTGVARGGEPRRRAARASSAHRPEEAHSARSAAAAPAAVWIWPQQLHQAEGGALDPRGGGAPALGKKERSRGGAGGAPAALWPPLPLEEPRLEGPRPTPREPTARRPALPERSRPQLEQPHARAAGEEPPTRA